MSRFGHSGPWAVGGLERRQRVNQDFDWFDCLLQWGSVWQETHPGYSVCTDTTAACTVFYSARTATSSHEWHQCSFCYWRDKLYPQFWGKKVSRTTVLGIYLCIWTSWLFFGWHLKKEAMPAGASCHEVDSRTEAGTRRTALPSVDWRQRPTVIHTVLRQQTTACPLGYWILHEFAQPQVILHEFQANCS